MASTIAQMANACWQRWSLCLWWIRSLLFTETDRWPPVRTWPSVSLFKTNVQRLWEAAQLCTPWPCILSCAPYDLALNWLAYICVSWLLFCVVSSISVMSLPCMLYYRVLSVLNCQGTTDANHLIARILCGVSNCDLGFKWLCKYNSHGYTCYTRRTFVNRRPRCIQWNKKWKVCYTKLGFKGYRT